MINSRSMSSAIVLILLSCCSFGQELNDTSTKLIIKDPQTYGQDVENYFGKIQSEFEAKLAKKKAKLIAEEAKLTGMVTKLDSGFGKFSSLINRDAVPQSGRNYIPLLDSISTSFGFLQHIEGDYGPYISKGMNAIKEAKNSLQQAELFEEQFNQRIAILKDRLLQMGKLKELKKLQERFFYYKSQVEDYRAMLNQPDKLIARSLMILQQTKAFKDFFARNSQLSTLFRIPNSANPIDPVALAGLQTVNSLQSMLMQRFGLSGSALQSQVQAPAPGVQELLNNLKDKMALKNGNGDQEMPNFKPDPLKNKSVWQRIEFGTNIQAQRANYFPATLDIAVTAAYLVNKKSSAGIGIAYKLGLGEVFRKIAISNQGVGLRSFVDMQWKKNFYLAGGFEMNYKSALDSQATLKDLSAWQKSGLLGVSRKFKAGNKLTGNAQLLWDFLSYSQVPRTPPFIFRFGYTFNK